MVLLLHDVLIMFQFRVNKQCCNLIFPDCLVFEIGSDLSRNRINSTQLEVSEKNVWMLIFAWEILGTQKKIPSCSKFFRYDAYSMALRGLYDVAFLTESGNIPSPSYCLRLLRIAFV